MNACSLPSLSAAVGGGKRGKRMHRVLLLRADALSYTYAVPPGLKP
jgi:hypothetical protein